MTDDVPTATSSPPPDPGNSGPEQWTTGEPYVDPLLDVQLDLATALPCPLRDPNDYPPPAPAPDVVDVDQAQPDEPAATSPQRGRRRGGRTSAGGGRG